MHVSPHLSACLHLYIKNGLISMHVVRSTKYSELLQAGPVQGPLPTKYPTIPWLSFFSVSILPFLSPPHLIHRPHPGQRCSLVLLDHVYYNAK